MLVMPRLPAALATGSNRSGGRRCAGRIGGRRARRVAGMLTKPCLQLPDLCLQLVDASFVRRDRPLLGVDGRLLFADPGTKRGVLPLQFVDAIVAPVTCHGRRSLDHPRHHASKRTCWGMAPCRGPSSLGGERLPASLPGRAHTMRLVSWSMMTVMYSWFLRTDSSSMPMRLSLSSRSAGSRRAVTRRRIEPTVRHATPMALDTVVWSAFCAKKATWSSKSRVNHESVSAQGTISTIVPQRSHLTRRRA